MDNGYSFYKLTPADDAELGIYENAMEYVFANSDIRNIAISGVYGAGKSSIIESYKRSHQEKNFIHISLAHFTPKENTEINDEDPGIKEDKRKQEDTALEGKIINQLIHQMKPRDIPLTNFRIKKDMNTIPILGVSLLVTAFLAIVCFLRFKDAWADMVNGFSIGNLREALSFTTTSEMEFALIIAALMILGIAVYEIIKFQNRVKFFKKFVFQGNEIEIFEESKDSYFDKYLNEVLYLFKHTDADGIIFEDIDRYDTNVIFEKLREINFLLNKSNLPRKNQFSRKNNFSKRNNLLKKNNLLKQNNKKSTGTGQRQVIRFFYLLRDDIFESKDRTKFFDFILPIVPIVDASNAYDKFIEYFKKANLLELFDMELVQRLSLYVDDMRVLKNICNEFIVYHERLKISFTEEGNNKLLAMIVYKNLFPKDFGCLQAGRGYIYTLFSEKKNFIRETAGQIQKEIDALQTENEKINSEWCDDLDELNSVYFVPDGRIAVEGKEEAAYGTRKEFVKAALQSNAIKRCDSNGYGNKWFVADITDQKKAMEENPEYVKRKALIDKKKNGLLQKNKKRIAELKRQLNNLEQSDLKNIITRENETAIFKTNYRNELDEIEEFAEVKRSPYFDLLKVLIREGYLDETYPDYMTYFYENSITANDKAFIRSITDRRKKPFDYPLNNVALVVNRMKLTDFKEREALNFKLLEQLLSDTRKYKTQLQNFLELIWNINAVDFVSGFLERNIARKEFVEEFNIFWPGANKWILSKDGFSLPQKRKYVADTLCISSKQVIDNNNAAREINNFVENDSDFLSVEVINKRKLKEQLKRLGIQFKDIQFETADKELLQFVYENNLYYLSTEIIRKFLGLYYGIPEGEELGGKNLSVILSKAEEPLCHYIKENLDFYLLITTSNILETDDTKEVVLYVLNNENVSEVNCLAYIASLKMAISRLDSVENKALWSGLLYNNKAQNTVKNLCDYYFLSGNGFDRNLVQFINGFDEFPVFDTSELDAQYGRGAAQKLFQDIATGNEISNDKYKGILGAFGMKLCALPQNKIAPDKLQILTEQGMLEMNENILGAVREYCPKQLMGFLLKNIEKYAQIMNPDIFSSSELQQLLERKINDELAIRLLAFETQKLSIRNKKYSPKVEDYIVEHLYNRDDLPYLVQWYPSNRVQLRKLIFHKAFLAVKTDEYFPCTLHPKLFEHLMQSQQITQSEKENLLIHQIKSGISRNTAKNAFAQLKRIEFVELLNGQSGWVPASGKNEDILLALLEKKWITSYERDANNDALFYVHKKAERKILKKV